MEEVILNQYFRVSDKDSLLLFLAKHCIIFLHIQKKRSQRTDQGPCMMDINLLNLA